MQSINKVGYKIVSLNEFILEGENFDRVSTAGQAKNNPSGFIRFNFKVKAVNEQARLPPAESPNTKILFGLMLKYL